MLYHIIKPNEQDESDDEQNLENFREFEKTKTLGSQRIQIKKQCIQHKHNFIRGRSHEEEDQVCLQDDDDAKNPEGGKREHSQT